MKKLKICLAVVCFMFSTALLSACGVTVTLTAETKVVNPGQNVQLISKVKDKELKYEDFTYEIVDGEEHASVNKSGLLSVKSTAIPNSVIKIQSEYDNTKSNVLEITVGRIAVTGVTLSAQATEVEQGSSLELSTVLTPTNTTDKKSDVVYTITQNASLAEILTTQDGKVKLSVNSDATINQIIKVKASLGDVVSNELSVKVVARSGGINIITLNEVSNNEITLDTTDADSLITLIPVFANSNSGVDANATFTVEVTEGEEFLAVASSDNKNFTFNVLGHGEAKIRVSAIGKQAEAVNVNVTTIVAPEQLFAPEYLSLNYQTGFGTKNYLPFEVRTEYNTEVYTGGVSKEFTYEFKLNNANIQEEANMPTVENNKIYFKSAGTYKIIVASKLVPTVKVEYTVVVNNYENVYTYEDLKSALTLGKSVNVVAYQKINGNFDLVPEFLINHTWTKDNEMELLNQANAATIDAKITASNPTIVINGNGHQINLSSMRLISTTTANTNQNKGPGALITIDPSYLTDEYLNKQECYIKNGAGEIDHIGHTADSKTVTSACKLDDTKYSVNINKLTITGACGVTGVMAGEEWNDNNYLIDDKGYHTGFYTRAIQIGSDRKFKQLTVNMDTVQVTGFSIGMRISGAKTVDSTASVLNNITIKDTFKAGMELSGNILTIQNSEFGLCGQGPIELTPDSCNLTGSQFNENQKVTMLDNTYTEAISDYETVYFNYYISNPENGLTSFATDAKGVIVFAVSSFKQKVLDTAGEQKANAVEAKLNSLIMNNQGEICFIALALGNGNSSTLDATNNVFDAFAEANIQRYSGNITEKYIKLDLTSAGLGSIYLYNVSQITE